jgi:Zn-finger nucleic acid-binding protein
MEKVPTPQGVIDRCVNCKGMWFDMLEDQDLKPYADEVDIGSSAVGAHNNKIDRIKCPACPDSQLIRMVDSAQPHIWFESCPVCYGRFFDAGEFRDLSEITIADVFRRFSAKQRD